MLNLNWCTNTNLIVLIHVWINVAFFIGAIEDIDAAIHNEHIEVEGARQDDVVGLGK